MTVAPVRRQTEEPTDAQVVARVRAGATHEFAILVGRYQRLLYRHAVTMVLDHGMAEDMVQDAFVRAYSRLGDCRDPERFRAWIFQTLRNRCLDHLKAPRRRDVPLDDAPLVMDPGDAPDALAERGETASRIAAALARLSPEQRETFIMHYVDGMPYERMSELFDVSVSALKMRALRAREALSAALREHVTEDAASSSL
jgi:RNA polymerase sigma-70 factor (ECF subfamily)